MGEEGAWQKARPADEGGVSAVDRRQHFGDSRKAGVAHWTLRTLVCLLQAVRGLETCQACLESYRQWGLQREARGAQNFSLNFVRQLLSPSHVHQTAVRFHLRVLAKSKQAHVSLECSEIFLLHRSRGGGEGGQEGASVHDCLAHPVLAEYLCQPLQPHLHLQVTLVALQPCSIGSAPFDGWIKLALVHSAEDGRGLLHGVHVDQRLQFALLNQPFRGGQKPIAP